MKSQKETTFFEYTSFSTFRKANLDKITHSKIHDKYREIRNIMDLIKDYSLNPTELSSLNEQLAMLETPPETPIKVNNLRPDNINIFKNLKKSNNYSHFPSVVGFNSSNTPTKTHKKSTNEPIEIMISQLQYNLEQNLEETRQLKEILIQNQSKEQDNPKYRSFLDALQESPNTRKFSESSFCKATGVETVETMSPNNKKININENDKVMGEISNAERKLYELQTQRFLNKIKELTNKNTNLLKDQSALEEKLQKLRDVMSQGRITGKIGVSRQLLKENLANISKEQVLKEEYEIYFLSIDVEGVKFYKDNQLNQIFRLISWEFLSEISLFEKEEEPLLGFYVMKLKDKDTINEYRLLKSYEHIHFQWDFIFLSMQLKLQGKNFEYIKYLRRKQSETLKEKEIPPIEIQYQSPTSLNPNNQKEIPQRNSNKNLKNSSFIKRESKTPPPSILENKKNINEINTSSRSLQPESGFRGSLPLFGKVQNYQSAVEFISSKVQPLRMSDRKKSEAYGFKVKSLNILKNGFLFLKYGKYGDPHERLVLLSICERKIEWRAINKKNANSLEIDTINDVVEGRGSAIFAKHKSKTQEQMNRSFFIVYSNNKTLDLEANSQENKQKFINSLRVLMRKEKNGSRSPIGRKIIAEEEIGKGKNLKYNQLSSIIVDEEGSEKEQEITCKKLGF